jgi:hypothetical protein
MPRRTVLNILAALCLGIAATCLVLTLGFWLLRLF